MKKDLKSRVEQYVKDKMKLLKKYGLQEGLTISFKGKNPPVLAKVCMSILRKLGGTIDTIWSGK